MASTGFTVSRSWVVLALVFIVGQNSNNVVKGFKQEMWLYLEDGIVHDDHLYFANKKANLTAYSEVLPKVKSYCVKGLWWTYENVNFQKLYMQLGSTVTPNFVCYNLDAIAIRSIRSFGSSDTTQDGLSLYSQTRYEGVETLVEGKEFQSGIYWNIGSISATGTSNWTLFEGQNFDGKSTCFKVPQREETNFAWCDDIERDFNLSTIGSVLKGCGSDSTKIQESTIQRMDQTDVRVKLNKGNIAK